MSDWADIQAALDAGEVVLLPTETVFGIAARADLPDAVAKIYDIKGRDFDKPLAVCVRDLAQAETLGLFSEVSRTLAARYWPGSVTLVVNASQTANLDPRVMGTMNGVTTIALRCPAAEWAHNLRHPIALTSANRSGAPDALDHDTAMADIGSGIAASLDSDARLSGTPSTIIRVANNQMTILRQGGLIVEGVAR